MYYAPTRSLIMPIATRNAVLWSTLFVEYYVINYFTNGLTHRLCFPNLHIIGIGILDVNKMTQFRLNELLRTTLYQI